MISMARSVIRPTYRGRSRWVPVPPYLSESLQTLTPPYLFYALYQLLRGGTKFAYIS